MPAVSRASAALEKAGIPTVTIVGSPFVRLATFTGESKGIRDLPVVPFAGAFSHETEGSFRDKLEQGVFEDIVEKLTGSIAEMEASVASYGKDREIVFTGTFEEVNQFFLENRWSDGLPIVPPTIEKVEEFLKFTDRSPDEEIAALPPANLRATPWNVAVNGVMAGCRPEFMPVFLAIVEAIGDKDYNLEHLGTTWCDVPFVVINGPIMRELDFKCEQGAISLGPNPAVGRFLGLAVKNLAGFRPRETYMATWGYPLPFAIAENEEQSPWEPYHVERGFPKNTSTVTVGGFFNWGPQKSFNDVRSLDAALTWLCDYAGHLIQVPKTWLMASTDMYTLFMSPPTARMFAEGGFSKRDLIRYFWQHTTITVGDLHTRFLDGAIGKAGTIRYYLMEGRVPESKIREFEALEAKGPGEVLPAIISPEEIHVFVTGDPGRDKVQFFWCWYNHPVTKEIRLPGKWNELTEKLGYPRRE